MLQSIRRGNVGLDGRLGGGFEFAWDVVEVGLVVAFRHAATKELDIMVQVEANLSGKPGVLKLVGTAI